MTNKSTPLQLLDRRDAVAELLKNRGDLLVVSGLGSPTYDVASIGDSPRNFYLWGAMGGAAMVGLGLALARPGESVLVVTGDGEQLMGLGALATIGAKTPKNLTIVALDNGVYGETGQQASHTAMGVDLHNVAVACGFARAHEVRDMEGVEKTRSWLDAGGPGPNFATFKITVAMPERVLPSRDGVYLKNRFREALEPFMARLNRLTGF
ncbi:MAG: thiamine pyrophosphate-dependent enzyme [Alphaproteobacteria bacterium]